MEKKHCFTAILKRLEGKIRWTVVYIPFSAQAVFGTESRVNVKVEIDGNPFQTTLLPSQNGHYFVFNQAMRDACEKSLGDEVEVIMERDTGARPILIPDLIIKALEASPGAKEAFGALPAYIQREEIQKIVSAKKPETQEKRLGRLLEILNQ